MFSIITFSLLILRISTTSSASTHLDIPVDPGHTHTFTDGHTDIPLLMDIPGHTIPLDLPLVSFPITHIGEFVGVIEFSQSPEGQLLSTIFEKFSS